MQNVQTQNFVAKIFHPVGRFCSSFQTIACSISQIFRSIVKAVPREIRAAKRHFSKNLAIRSLCHLFQKTAPTPIPKVETPLHGANLLKQHIEKLEPLPQIPHEKSKSLGGVSALKKIASEWEVSSDDLLVLTDSFSLSDSNAFLKLEGFLDKFFIQKKKVNPLSGQTKEAFSQAMKEAKDLKNLSTLDRDLHTDIEMKAKQMRDSVLNLNSDRPFLYCGSLSNNNRLSKGSFLDAFIKNKLPESVYQWMSVDRAHLPQLIKNSILKEIGKSGCEIQELQKFGGQIEKNVQNVLKKCSQTLNP